MSASCSEDLDFCQWCDAEATIVLVYVNKNDEEKERHFVPFCSTCNDLAEFILALQEGEVETWYDVDDAKREFDGEEEEEEDEEMWEGEDE